MTNEDYGNLPANPTYNSANYKGLTKREYFAAVAMQGLCGNTDISMGVKDLGDWALKQADALIAALNKEAQP